MAKKMGAPHKGDDGKRVTVTMRITPNESAVWHKAAAKAGISFSRYVLDFVREHHKEQKPNKEGR
jgi:uncharacterized protein (DUF1778 family)